jgi:hypothetical protein
MTTEDKTRGEGKKEEGFREPFGRPWPMREMMRMWCRPGMKVCDCCQMEDVVKEEAS